MIVIKTSTMNLVMTKSQTFWSNGNLVNCFVETLEHLITGLDTGFIGDVFFPEVIVFYFYPVYIMVLGQSSGQNQEQASDRRRAETPAKQDEKVSADQQHHGYLQLNCILSLTQTNVDIIFYY